MLAGRSASGPAIALFRLNMLLEVIFYLLIVGLLVGTPALLLIYGIYVAFRYGVRGQPTDAELSESTEVSTDDQRAA